MIGDVAHKIENVNADAVTNALKHADRIIGTGYMTAGNGDGGPCHPRVTHANLDSLIEFGSHADKHVCMTL